MKSNFIFRQLLRLLKPQTNVAGLDISETAIHFIELQENRIKKHGISLEQGIIENGRIKDKDRFLQALVSFKSQFARAKEKVPVIVSVPANNIYTQAFSLPLLNEANIQEAAGLNLHMISPIDVKTSYSDWQNLNDIKTSNRAELLGAFANKDIIDEFVSALSATGFVVLAVEFPGLAVSRTIKHKARDIDLTRPQIVLAVSSDGLDFLIIKDGNLYFNYFVSWLSIKGGINQDSREILLRVFNDVLVQEMKRVFNFYSSHWGGQADQLILMTHGLFDEITAIIKGVFPHLAVQPLVLSEFEDLAPSWYASLGSAIRGTFDRSKDHYISLSAVSTEDQFRQTGIVSFIQLWRNIFITALSLVVVMYAIGDLTLWQSAGRVNAQIDSLSQSPESQELATLQQKAVTFNKLVDRTLAAKTATDDFMPVFNKISALAKSSSVTLNRFFLDGPRSSVVFNGQSASEVATVDFKNKLADDPMLKDVSLPLSDIVTNADGSVSFSLSFSF